MKQCKVKTFTDNTPTSLDYNINRFINYELEYNWILHDIKFAVTKAKLSAIVILKKDIKCKRDDKA